MLLVILQQKLKNMKNDKNTKTIKIKIFFKHLFSAFLKSCCLTVKHGMFPNTRSNLRKILRKWTNLFFKFIGCFFLWISKRVTESLLELLSKIKRREKNIIINKYWWDGFIIPSTRSIFKGTDNLQAWSILNFNLDSF